MCFFICLLIFSMLYSICSSSWRWKRSKSAPTEAPLSHRKHCSWNASSVAPPLSCHTTSSCQCCIIYAWRIDWHKKWIQHSCSVVVSGSWVRRVWADQSEQTGYPGGGALNRPRWNTVSQNWTIWESWCVLSSEACRLIVVVTQNKSTNQLSSNDIPSDLETLSHALSSCDGHFSMLFPDIQYTK